MKKEVRFKPRLFFGHVRSHEVPLALTRAVTQKSGPQEGRCMRNWERGIRSMRSQARLRRKAARAQGR